MIYMSQSGLTDRTRESDWDRWYDEHLASMAGVPGIASAQRFKCADPSHPPSLSMYSVASAEVLEDAQYLKADGMGEWLALVDRAHYRRNLFEGAERAPEVRDGELLLVADRDKPEPGRAGIEWKWLECVGLDRSTGYRGIAVVPPRVADRARRHAGIAVYAAATPCHKPASHSSA
jgi:hypothetical protein